jgi:hypothetical protein
MCGRFKNIRPIFNKLIATLRFIPTSALAMTNGDGVVGVVAAAAARILFAGYIQ